MQHTGRVTNGSVATTRWPHEGEQLPGAATDSCERMREGYLGKNDIRVETTVETEPILFRTGARNCCEDCRRYPESARNN